MERISTKFGNRDLILETGKLAGQAAGAVTVQYGDTVILVTASVEEPREGIDYFPLLIDYEEKFYASGKISGSRFIKREGRPSLEATLTARQIDRPIRPLFPEGFRNDVQIVVTALSADLEMDPGLLGTTGASAALTLTDLPFKGPIASARVGIVDGNLVLNPSYEQLEESPLDLVISGNKDKPVMIEAGADELSKEVIEKAIEFGQKSLQPAIDIQKELVEKVGKQSTVEHSIVTIDSELKQEVKDFVKDDIEDAIYKPTKEERRSGMDQLEEEAVEHFISDEDAEDKESQVRDSVDKAIKNKLRANILEGKRPDGRDADEVRELEVETDVLPVPHGSALFRRGGTQALSVLTLDSPEAVLFIDTMERDTTKRFLHHYNFPPYATGEVRPMRSPKRRELGHGALARRAVEPLVPEKDDFPYTMRVVSEILSSNGSSSMASVCGTSLSLMDGGVPLKKHVAGIAMGMVHESDDNYQILTDIAGVEDFNGDMDFKVAGTKDGITAIQLDMKIEGLSMEIISETLNRAEDARLEIIDTMSQEISSPRSELAENAPQVALMEIDPDKIGNVIGSGGKVINRLIENAGGEDETNISIEDDGSIFISSTKKEWIEDIKQKIEELTEEVEPGKLYRGEVVRVKDFGAFVEILPGKDGLVHISELADHHVDKVTDVVEEGDEIPVIVKEIDDQDRINLSYIDAKKQLGEE